jgi:hypothetical protein
MKRYASWGSDSTYRWLWRAALQDAIWAFKQRMKKEAEIFQQANRINELEESLRDCASKLESQVSRNPELPKSYAEVVTKAFALLNAK